MKISYFLMSLMLCFGFAAQAQNLTITGKVTSEDDPTGMPGANVLLKGTSTGTVTDITGSYSLEVPDTESVLVFSSIGFVQAEVTVGNNTVIDMVMVADITALEEIVVTGYGSQKRATITGSVGSVKSEELTQRPVANTTDLLQGRVAGLYTRQDSGLPGADAATLNIRGFGSNPLVLIDGLEGNMASIDPNDIESISVLKDASAAIYGARAGNGVILITTKRGSASPAKISYHGNISFNTPTFLPDIVEARKWAELLHESGLNPDDYSPEHISYDPETKRLTNAVDGSDYTGYDWDEELYKEWTPQQQHNLSARGGTEKVKYFISAGFIDQQSNFKSGDYDFQRYSIRSNLDADITKNLGVSVDLSYRISELDKANFGVSEMYNSLQTAKPVYPVIHEEDPTRATFSGFLQRSPYYQTFKDFSGFQNNKTNILQGAIELRYNFPFVKGLRAKARFDYTETNRWNKRVSKPFDVWEYEPLKALNGEDPWGRRGTQNANNMNVYSDRQNVIFPLASLEYENTFNNHYLKVAAIAESRTYNWTSLSGSRRDILSFEAPYLIYASEDGKDNAENVQTDGDLGTPKRGRTSYIGRINYDYQSKYLLEATLRADASAEYPPEGRWGFFPSVSAGWRLSEESFIRENVSFINNLKLRGSYGILGNDAVSSFDYLTGYTISTNYYIYGSTPAPIIASAGLANPDITWETMKMSNIALEGTMWNGLLGFEVDVFYRLREDILTQPTTQVPSTFGAALPRTNLNKQNR
jgi:TonB-linked SusC/RagA family outer membrane protein